MTVDWNIVLTAVSAFSTALAAGFAAWSARTSQKSSKSAEDSVEEARKARKAAQTPRLVLERDFLDFRFEWPHSQSLNGEPVFLARRHWKDNSPSPPTFTLANYGQTPGLEVQLHFELDDSNGELTLPAMFQSSGLTVGVTPTQDIKCLTYKTVSLPLYRTWTLDIPHMAPGQKRTVEFPQPLLNRLFLRGLQQWARRGEENSIQPLVLTIKISCHTVDGDPFGTQFRFKAFPFFSGLQTPMVVLGHFNELPIHPVTRELPVT
jgi:hypothetical protein